MFLQSCFSGKWLCLKNNYYCYYWTDPFFTFMIMGGRVNTMHLDVDWKPPLAILQLFSEAYFSGKNDQIWALNHDQDVFPHWILSHQIP